MDISYLRVTSMIKWDMSIGMVSITYPNGIIVTIRENIHTYSTQLDIYFRGQNVNKEVYAILTGEVALDDNCFDDINATTLTEILNRVSNLTIRR